MPFVIQQIGASEGGRLEALNTLFGTAFGDVDRYTAKRPSQVYLSRLLSRDNFIALIATENDEAIGGLVAYELHKFEQECSEIYIYDLAVLESHRRRGVATVLINELRRIGQERGAYVIFVQADTDEDDEAAIALYTKLGRREEVLHFDIEV